MEDEEKLISQLVKVSKAKNYYGKAEPLAEAKEVVVVGCFKDPKLDGYVINGGLFLSSDEAKEYL
tara:strand:+ start:6987 stop:7181 length:195 start_codon:yes stop_codon:yes gene_type:complete